MLRGCVITHSNKTVYVRCEKPAARCFLIRSFAPLQNVHVFTGKTPYNWFVCNLALRGTDKEVKDAMPTGLDIVRQTCAACQQQQRSLR